MRQTTIRLPEGLAEVMDYVARVDEMPSSELIRKAIALYIERRRADPAFQERLHARMEADRAFLQGLEELSQS